MVWLIDIVLSIDIKQFYVKYLPLQISALPIIIGFKCVPMHPIYNEPPSVINCIGITYTIDGVVSR